MVKKGTTNKYYFCCVGITIRCIQLIFKPEIRCHNERRGLIKSSKDSSYICNSTENSFKLYKTYCHKSSLLRIEISLSFYLNISLNRLNSNLIDH